MVARASSLAKWQHEITKFIVLWKASQDPEDEIVILFSYGRAQSFLILIPG